MKKFLKVTGFLAGLGILFEVAIIEPARSIIMGHHDNDTWTDVWQFILVPQNDGTTRFILRGRSTLTGWLWDVVRPGEFIMMRRIGKSKPGIGSSVAGIIGSLGLGVVALIIFS